MQHLVLRHHAFLIREALYALQAAHVIATDTGKENPHIPFLREHVRALRLETFGIERCIEQGGLVKGGKARASKRANRLQPEIEAYLQQLEAQGLATRDQTSKVAIKFNMPRRTAHNRVTRYQKK